MNRLILLAMVVFCCVTELTAQDLEKYRYLALATNEAFTLMNAPATSLDNLAAGTRVGCKALNMLLDDQNFRGGLDKWAASAKRSGVASEQKALQDELGNFVAIFANTEIQVLANAGVTDEAAQDIVIAAATFRTELSAPIDSRKLLADIQALRDQLCAGSDTLAKLQTQQERLRLYRRWAIGTGGVALIAFDGLSSVPTAGIAAGSIAIGGAMLGSALPAK